MVRIPRVVPPGIPPRMTPHIAGAHVAGDNDMLGTVGVQPAWMDWSCHPAATLVDSVMQSLSGRRRHGRHCSRGVSRSRAEGPGNW